MRIVADNKPHAAEVTGMSKRDVATPKLDLVHRCYVCIAGFVTMDDGQQRWVDVGCHRSTGHKGRHRGWVTLSTRNRVRISWKNEER